MRASQLRSRGRPPPSCSHQDDEHNSKLGAALLPRGRQLTRPVHGRQRSMPDPQEQCRPEEHRGWRWEESEHVTCDSTGQAPWPVDHHDAMFTVKLS